MNNLEGKTILVTGATGYIAAHVVKQLLEAKSRVIGTVRNVNSEDTHLLKQALGDLAKNLSFEEADLNSAQNWSEIVSKCDYVVHVASPVFFGTPKNQDAILKQAVDGTKFVLEACAEHNIKKVVVTSSISAIFDQKDKLKDGSHFTVNDYSDEDCLSLYDRTKVRAEKMAWKIAKENNLNLTTINPGLVIGELLIKKKTPSQEVVERMLNSCFWIDGVGNTVSVYDTARAHVKALEFPELSKNRRYILVEKSH